MEIKNRLINGNNLFVKQIDNNEFMLKKRQELVKGQSPFCLVITCSDSRVIPETIFSKTFGDLFVIRTAGNVINEGELASVEYGIEHLHIPLVVVMGHTHCGAVHAAIKNEKGQYLDPILNRIKKNIDGIDDEKGASKANALKEVGFIKKMFPKYSGEVIAMLYDLEQNTAEII